MSSINTSTNTTKILKEFERKIDEYKELETGKSIYNDVLYGDELTLNFLASKLSSEMFEFIDQVIDNEKPKLRELKMSIIQSIKNNKKSRSKLIKMKEDYEQQLDKINNEFTDKPDRNNKYTFQYHHAMKPVIKKEIEKKMKDIADVQLLIEISQDDKNQNKNTLQELNHQLYEHYENLNKYNLEVQIHEIFEFPYVENVNFKTKMYNDLISIIDSIVIKLNQLRETIASRPRRSRSRRSNSISVAGKKKTYKKLK